MRLPITFAFVVIALTQPGFTCGPGVDPPGMRCEAGEAPSARVIEVGETDADGAFAPLAAGQVYPPEFGSQGGQHIYVAVRFFAFEGEAEWGHRFRLLDDDGNEFGSRFVVEGTCAPGWTVLSNLLVFVDPVDAAGGRIEVESGPIDAQGALTEVATTAGPIALR